MEDIKITYRHDQVFWLQELFLQLAFHYIYAALPRPQYRFTNKEELLYDCRMIVNGYRSSYLTFPWDQDELANPADQQMMIMLLQDIVADLRTRRDQITVAELQAMPTEDDHWLRVMDKPFPVAELIRIFEALTAVFRGSWKPDNYRMNIDW